MQRLLGAGKSVAAAAAGAFTRKHRALSSSSMLFDDTQIQVCVCILVCIVFFMYKSIRSRKCWCFRLLCYLWSSDYAFLCVTWLNRVKIRRFLYCGFHFNQFKCVLVAVSWICDTNIVIFWEFVIEGNSGNKDMIYWSLGLLYAWLVVELIWLAICLEGDFRNNLRTHILLVFDSSCQFSFCLRYVLFMSFSWHRQELVSCSYTRLLSNRVLN